MSFNKKFGGGFRNDRGGGRFDRPGEGRRGGFGGGDRRPPFKKFGKPSFGGNRGGFGGRDDRGPREMFEATCAECGNTCEVPFRPNGEKPVFCDNCFSAKKGADDFQKPFERREDRREDRRPAAPASAPATNVEKLEGSLKSLHAKVDALVAMFESHSHGTHAPVATVAVSEVHPDSPAPDKAAKNAKTKKVEKMIKERKATSKKKAK